jgi:hypothetical protein
MKNRNLTRNVYAIQWFWNTVEQIPNGERKKELFLSSDIEDIWIFRFYLLSNHLYEKSFEEYFQNKYVFSQWFNKFLQYFSQKILENLPSYSSQERKSNIQHINKTQFWSLLNQFCFAWEISQNRTLVLYFRELEMPFFEFLVLQHIVKELIKRWKTQVFNQVRIVGRESQVHESYQSYLDMDDFLSVKWKDFKRACSVYANTIHLTHWQVFENWSMRTTTPIVWGAILNDSQSMYLKNQWIQNKVIPLDLDFRSKICFHSAEIEITDLMQKMTQSILNCENKMLWNK